MKKLAAAISFLFAVAAPLAAEAPLTIGWPGWPPFWIDVRAALTPDGEFDPQFFGDPIYESLVDTVIGARCERVPFGMSFPDRIDSRACVDFDCAIRSAEFIAQGEIVGGTFGFGGGEPGQLLEVRPLAVLKGEWSGASLYVYYPVAELCAGGKTIVKTDERYPEPPKVGGRVFLFSGSKPWDDGWVWTEYEGDIVPVGPDGHLLFGNRSGIATSDGPTTASDLFAQISAIAATREQRLKHTRDPDGTPYLLYFSGNLYPEWVDARVALDEDGRLDPTLFPDEMLRNVGRAAIEEAVPGRAIRVGDMNPETKFDEEEERSLAQVATNAAEIALARASGRTYGFWWGIPGQLFRLDIEKSYRGGTVLDPVYLFVPQGDFELGSIRILKTDSRFPDPPQIGDEVFLFSYPHIRSNLSVPIGGRGFAVVDSDGRLRLGSDYRTAEEVSDRPIRTRNDLIERILAGNAEAAPPH